MKRLNKISFLILVLFVILLIPQAQFSMSAVGENCCEDDECGQCQECDGADIDCPGEYEEGYGTCEIAPDGVCSGCTQGTCGCVCDDGNCRADCSSAPACCGQCESCDGTYCVAQDSNSCDTCSSGSCECRAGRCVDSYSGMAAYKFKNEYDILGLEHESINRFACSGLLGVNIIDDGSGFMQIGGSETCCDPGEVICGFKGDTDGENEIDDMKCCPVEASQGGTITIQKVDSWVDPEGRNTEGTCGYNTVAICGAQHGNDGLDRLKCAYIEIDGTTAPWIGFEVAFRDVDENEEVFCPGGTGGPPPRPPPPCEERSDSECQVEGPTSDCRLCPTPNQNKYAYNFSDINPNTVVTGGSACVNITNDPFNCGQCGFNPGGTSTVYSGNQGFCPSDRPFCVGSCVGRGGASFGVNPSSNPYFYYEVVKNGDLYHSVWGDGSSSSNPIYLSHDINQYENICQAAIGSAADFVDGLGCCGDGKCRELTGMKCNVGAVCDGAIWHDVRDPSIEGEVFKAPACGGEIHNYPIANLNNMFVKCVDADRIVRYIQSHNYQLCVPEYAFNAYPDYYTANPVWRITGPNENIAGIDGKLTGGRAYVCGQEMYQIGGHSGRFTNRNSCPGHPIYGWTIVPETDLVCDVKPDTATSTYVFAAVVDTTKTVFDTGDDGNPPGREGYEICPAPVLDWRELSGNAYVEPRESIAVLPCPGRISLSEFDNLNLEHKTPGGGTWSVSYGKTDWRMVELCKARATPDENIGYYKLPGLFYYFSNGTIMGEVENNSYACFTDETMTPGNQEPARAKIGVCCGDDGCTDIPGTIGEGGVEFSPGQYINASGRILFCLGDGSWSMDMDNESLQDSCTNAGFLATGRYCCAEQDDTSLWINESYSDL
ncbi:hypothetical protein KY348_04890, partial [Candidatus Woesearchaeota archaeon]|nr:hypothetical protein [Candidatus Woesearchaeota archaeon]